MSQANACSQECTLYSGLYILATYRIYNTLTNRNVIFTFSQILPERKKFKKNNKCRKNVAKKEQNEALTSEVRNREFWDFLARIFSGIIYLCKIL